MAKAVSCLRLVNVSVESVLSPARPTSPTRSLASGSQSADLHCRGDLLFRVGYLSTNTSCSLFASLFSILSLFFSFFLLSLLSCHRITSASLNPVLLFALPSPFTFFFSSSTLCFVLVCLVFFKPQASWLGCCLQWSCVPIWLHTILHADRLEKKWGLLL